MGRLSRLEGLEPGCLSNTVQFLDLCSAGRLASASRELTARMREKPYFAEAMAQDFLAARRASCNAQGFARAEKYALHAHFVRLFPLDFGGVTEECQEATLAALAQVIAVARRDSWDDLALFAQQASIHATQEGYEDILESLLHMRLPLEADSSSDEEAEEDADMQVDRRRSDGARKLGGSNRARSGRRDRNLVPAAAAGDAGGGLVLEPAAIGRVLLGCVLVANREALRRVLEAATASDRLRAADVAAALQDGCAAQGLSAEAGLLMAHLARLDPARVEPVLRSSLQRAAMHGEAEFAASMAQMLAARLTPRRLDTAAAAELAERRELAHAAMSAALSAAAREGHTGVVRTLAAGAFAPVLVTEAHLRACAQTAAVNGRGDLLRALVLEDRRVPESLVGELADGAVRRGHPNAVRACLATGLLPRAYLVHQRQQAFLREHDDVVAVLDEALADMPPDSDDEGEEDENDDEDDDEDDGSQP